LTKFVLKPSKPKNGAAMAQAVETLHADIATLKRAGDELTAIFENASIAILFVRERIILRCNARAAEIFGYSTAEELVGKPSLLVYPDADSHARLGAEAYPILGEGKSYRTQWLLRKRDGRAVWCDIYAKAVDPLDPESGTVWMIKDITEAKEAIRELHHSKHLLDTTFTNMDQGISVVDADLNILGVNRRFKELFNFPPAFYEPGAKFEDWMRYNAQRGEYGPGDVEELVRARVELARRFEAHQFERVRPDGTVLEVRGLPAVGGGFVTIYTDITKRARAEGKVRESEVRFRSLTQLSSDWFWEQDPEYRFTRMEGHHITGLGTNFEGEFGKTFWDLGFEVKGGREALDAVLAQRQSFRDVVMRCAFSDGTVHHIRVSGEPVFDDAGAFTGYRGLGRDITQEQQVEERLQHMATHDNLTGLPNRALFHEILGIAIQSARRYGRKMGVMFIDLDHFKAINDTLGHDAGDALLKEVATRFVHCLRGSDSVARLGGDEFVILLQEISDTKYVAEVARRILHAAIEPVMFQGLECRVSASIGICMFPANAHDEESLMKNADSAMYAAKEKGKNNFQFFSKDAALQKTQEKPQ